MPMDRLICGDVGYGKTEIAVRAAFKAVQDGKQVAILVPTTLLVQQHFTTFTERYAAFPVKVRQLSRFQTAKEAEEPCSKASADGTVDVVIGTHRLLQATVRFKDLGLVVVDEEQRFGVEHKEHLKALRTQVDVLTMSATPIPRTLEMAITGIREMSTIATPPEERHPVLTFVGAYDDKQVARRSAASCCARARSSTSTTGSSRSTASRPGSGELVPEARIAVAHGQMDEDVLEQVIVDFWEKRVRRARLHHHRRVGPGHPQRQHAHRRARRRASASRSCTSCAAGSAAAASAAYAYFLYPAREAADRDRPRAARHHRPAHRARARAWLWP